MNIDNKTYNPWYYYIGRTLVKKIKPCLPNQQIHIKNLNGCFTVIDVSISYFVIIKNRKYIQIPWDDFICLKGEGVSIETKIKKELKYYSYMLTNNIETNKKLVNEITEFIKRLKK